MAIRVKVTHSSHSRSAAEVRTTQVLGFLGVLALSLHGFLSSNQNLLPYLQVSSSFKDDSSRNVEQSIKASARLLAPCLFNKTVICRFDNVGRFLEETPTITPVVHRHIQAVPSYRRTPHEMANNRTYIANGLTSFPDDLKDKDATNATLNEYNPTILPLYRNVKNGPSKQKGGISSDLDPKLLDELTGRYHPGFSDAEADQVQYLSVTRSSNHYPKCIPDGGYRKGQDKPYDWVNYPGLALLDRNLQPIDGADVLIDIEKYYFHPRRNVRAFQDFTIFAARTTEGNKKRDQLFLMTNGMHVLPLSIRRVPPGVETDESDWKTKIDKSRRIPNDSIFGTGLQVRMTHPGNHSNIDVHHKSVRMVEGKNMHILESRNGTTYIEIWPHSAHVVMPVNFFSNSFTSFDDYSWQIEGNKQIVIPDLHTNSSFVSIPRGTVRMKTPLNRGTACCAHITLADGREAKLGIAHSVATPLNYLHRFYVFLPEEPFQVIALSGHFCLGGMTINDTDSEHHWISKQDNIFQPEKTRIGQGVYDCPSITFASGITNMIGHGDNYIILSYGVGDCYSRSIFVHKKKIELLLFPDASLLDTI